MNNLTDPPKVRGYIKPESAFHTLDEWEELAVYLLDLQTKGLDTRGGEISCKHTSFCSIEEFDKFVGLLSEYFEYQLTTEVDRWELLTRKNVLDFIEDFINHRLWAIERQFGSYFPNVRKLKIAYFYSRGDMEPYVLMDDEFTTQLYGSVNNPKELLHYTSPEGLERLEASIGSGMPFDISTFTVAMRPFFRPESNIVVHLVGNVRGGFRSDIKSMAVDNKRRALNLHRLDYPGHDQTNICHELESCDGNVKTSLWNEYIATPIEILSITWT